MFSEPVDKTIQNMVFIDVFIPQIYLKKRIIKSLYKKPPILYTGISLMTILDKASLLNRILS
ncbi:hypothetical protein MASR2M70_14970 [Bacillota bacterium]